MIARRTSLLLALLALTAWACLLALKPSAGTLPSRQWPAAVSSPADKETGPAADAVPDAAPSLKDEPVPPAAEAHPPVQSVEVRRDALLFESEALYGTPFDRAVVLPFD